MAPKWGFKFYTQQAQVTEGDGYPAATPWCDLVSDIEHTWGPFEPFGAGGPHVLSFRARADALTMLDDPLQDAAICFYGPCGADTPTPYAELLDNGDYERVLFYGEQPDFKGSTERPNWMQIQMPGYDSAVLNYKAHIGSGTNHGVQATLILLEAEGPGLGLESNAWEAFPDATVGYTLDRAAQGASTAAAYLASHTAGYGMWVTGEYMADYTGDAITGVPRMAWRPSIIDTGWMDTPPTSRQEIITITRPWLFQFLDYGQQWGDHPNKVTVTGTGGATGASSHGAARYIHRDVDVTTFIDNSPECAHAALNLLRTAGMPHINIFDLRIDIELLYKKLVQHGESTDDAEALCWKLGAVRVGDSILFDYDSGSGFEEPAPATSYTSSEVLQEITAPDYEKKQTTGSGRQGAWNVTRVRRTWNHRKGWTVYISLRVQEGW